MTGPARLSGAQPAPHRRVPKQQTPEELRAQMRAEIEAEMRAEAAEGIDSRTAYVSDGEPEAPPLFNSPVPPAFSGARVDAPAANPYAPTGWGANEREEMDLVTPSGQNCRVRRLERDDVIDLGLLKHLDTFTPLLLDTKMSDAEKVQRAEALVRKNPHAMGDMFGAVDKVVEAACVSPRVTFNQDHEYMGGPMEWADPTFTATIYIKRIDIVDRMAIFNAAFGRSIDQLKSVGGGQESGVGSLADDAVLPQDAE